MTTKLLKLRLEQGLKQKNIAQGAGISIRQYQMIEAGKSSPSVSKAIAIAKALNLPVEVIFGDTEHANYSTFESKVTEAECPGKSIVELALKAWKESKEAVEALDPAILADGIEHNEMHRIEKEAQEAIESLELIREHIRPHLNVA